LSVQRENAKGSRKSKLEDAYARYIEQKSWKFWKNHEKRTICQYSPQEG
jgi:hypothetical protein